MNIICSESRKVVRIFFKSILEKLEDIRHDRLCKTKLIVSL